MLAKQSNNLSAGVMKIEIKELTQLELLKISLEYSISRKHQNSLAERIAKLEGNPVDTRPLESKTQKNKKTKLDQQSFL